MTDLRLPATTESALDRLALLHEPVRRRVFAFVAGASASASASGATRDETAIAVGIDRPLAAFHLERLLEAGLLEADFGPTTLATAGGASAPEMARPSSGGSAP